ncbi:hypothetical protein TURU_138440 [Turdus rufiventris]|nr:hypothetical protein TURU_138440 [Turdus rufiventris]
MVVMVVVVVRQGHGGGGGAGHAVHGVVRGVGLERVALALRHGDVDGGQSLGPRQQGLIEAGEDIALQLQETQNRAGFPKDEYTKAYDINH